ncbi:MAG: radical SAM protein [bacterium]
MKIQSLSIVVPNTKCINKCKFCVSSIHKSKYENMLRQNNLYWDLYEKDYINRLEFARDNGCNTVMLTGNSEPQQNRQFLKMFGSMNKQLTKPFRIIEMQTTGVLIDNDYLYFLRHHVGVNTISLSISSFRDKINQNYNGTKSELKVCLSELCSKIKKYRFNLRISINLTDDFNALSPEKILNYCKKELKADQVTFRVLYESNKNTEQDMWIKKHKANAKLIDNIKKYIRDNGRALEKLEFGNTKYSIKEMSVVLDDDCMSTDSKEALKYLILRENCKLYSKWNDKGSLIF